MYSKAAMKWAEKVFAKRPVSVLFVQRPSQCRSCDGYHKAYSVRVDPDGVVTYAFVYDHHAIVVDPVEISVGEGVEALAQVGYKLLRWARATDKFAPYPPMGTRVVGGYLEEVWF